MIHGRPFARQNSVRFVALAVICAGHVGFVVLLDLSSEPRWKRTFDASQEPLLVSFIEQPREVPLLPAIDGPNTPPLKPPSLAPLTISMPVDIESSTTPTLIPPIDMAAELERAARSAVARQVEKESLPQFGAAPKGMGPPPQQKSPELGDSEHLEGGEVITWINERCHYSNKPPPGPDLGAVRLQLPWCRRKSKKWYQDFETWRRSKSELLE